MGRLRVSISRWIGRRGAPAVFTRIVTLEPVDIEFAGLTIRVQSIFRLAEGTGQIEIIRKIVDTTDPQAEVSIDEYITACYGTTEYPEDLSGVRLTLKGQLETECIEYAYQSRQAQMANAIAVEAAVPQVDTRLSLFTNSQDAIGYFREGYAFSPMFTLGIKKILRGKGEIHSWLKVEKAS